LVSIRFCIFDTSGKIVAYHQVETRSIYPKEGYMILTSHFLYLFSEIVGFEKE